MLWVVSAIGGIGGNTGRPVWWALILIPYPAGLLLGLIVRVRKLREDVRKSDSPARAVRDYRTDE